MSRSPHRGPKSRSRATESAQAEHMGLVDIFSPGWVLSAIISGKIGSHLLWRTWEAGVI